MKTKSNWQKPIAIKLYKLVKISMSEKGITQVMLANKMGVEKGNMWKILNSLKKGKLPSFNISFNPYSNGSSFFIIVKI